jgi:nitrogen fixation/metabolism regulation signal transduction histidine kinase
VEVVDTAALKRRRGYIFMALGAGAVLSMLLLLGYSVENSDQFARWRNWILGINAAGVVLTAILLARRVARLVRDYRNHVPGSRLTTRTVLIFGALVVVPLLVMYLFWLGFLNRGINSWFKEGVKEPLQQSVLSSGRYLELLSSEYGQRTAQLASQLGSYSDAGLAAALEAGRATAGARELVVYNRDGTVFAASIGKPGAPPDVELPRELLTQIRAGQPYAHFDFMIDSGDYVFLSAAPLPDTGAGAGRFLVARQLAPRELSAMIEAANTASITYKSLSDSRQPLKYSFLQSLTLVLLLAMLSAIFLAIRFAHKLTRPVHDLIQGTRAVGKGEFGKRLALPSHDEMGILVQSFNDMTKRLRRASEETARSRALVENERERLAVILAGLSTGVLVIDTTLKLRLANAAADAILGESLAAWIGTELAALPDDAPRLMEFARELARRLENGEDTWQDEIALPPDRVVRCACAPLPDGAGEAGYVIVFDDISNLLHAQRDAAWGEVARRLAHEIKNPLTPIQLAAERLRRRLQGKLAPDDADVLERATHTIVQQVETLKGMVNAFSEYARDPELKLTALNLNDLTAEVVELYRAQGITVTIDMQTDPALPPVLADRGRLRQVLNNLITNALEAVEGVAGARVAVATQMNSGPAPKSAVIMVTDNGHGFDRDMLARVFDPYVTSKPRGTGLGLAIVKKIAEEHGGSIEANNLPEGGAYVRVVIPIAPPMQATQMARGIA